MLYEEDSVEDFVTLKWFSTILFGILATLFFVRYLRLKINLALRFNDFNQDATAYLEMVALASSMKNATRELNALLIYLENDSFIR